MYQLWLIFLYYSCNLNFINFLCNLYHFSPSIVFVISCLLFFKSFKMYHNGDLLTQILLIWFLFRHDFGWIPEVLIGCAFFDIYLSLGIFVTSMISWMTYYSLKMCCLVTKYFFLFSSFFFLLILSFTSLWSKCRQEIILIFCIAKL